MRSAPILAVIVLLASSPCEAGWYLLTPPVDKSTVQADRPLGEWQHRSAHDSHDECAGTAAFLRDGAAEILESLTASSGRGISAVSGFDFILERARQDVAGLAASRCVQASNAAIPTWVLRLPTMAGDGVDAAAPLREWTDLGRYVTAKSCEADKWRRRKLVTDEMDPINKALAVKSDDDLNRQYLDRARVLMRIASARCIATDDPRLK